MKRLTQKLTCLLLSTAVLIFRPYLWPGEYLFNSVVEGEKKTAGSERTARSVPIAGILGFYQGLGVPDRLIRSHETGAL